jgi:Zn-finger nucleic acid-binding protein
VLFSEIVSDVLLGRCPECTGVFVDGPTFDRIVADRDRQAVLASALQTHTEPDRVEEKVKYLPCPDCSNLMWRTNFGKRSGVIIDVCKKHGYWFDADELRRVIEFVRSGGLDETRRREIEELNRKIRERKAELQRPQRGVQGTVEYQQAMTIESGALIETIFGLLDWFGSDHK